MLTKRRLTSILAVSTLAVLMIAGCGGGSSSDKTATPRATSTSSATGAAGTAQAGKTPSVDIRSLDIEKLPDVAALLLDTSGGFSKDDVLYADLTGDGSDEAVVPISSGGTMGDIAFIVLMADGNDTKTLLKEYPSDQSGLSVAVQDAKVVMTQPVPGPDDPFCCPSFLKKTTYGWNGYAMALEGVTTDPNPNAGGKGTPAADITPAPIPTQPPGVAPEGTAASGDRPKPPAPGAVP